ncbi:MAG: DUF2004 domain-containing protein [Ferruginibacter sp.]|nr:DUF2004 domain-containing protein [Ferruginibacter sp.]
MAYISLPHFGSIESSSLEEYYETIITFNGIKIKIDLNFENKTSEPDRLQTVKNFIENIRIYDLNNKGYINDDYTDAEADTVKSYLAYHLEELGGDELSDLIDTGSKSIDHEKQLLKKLHLVRVGIYPNNKGPFAAFDYSIGPEITAYLIVVNTDENGNLDYLTMER